MDIKDIDAQTAAIAVRFTYGGAGGSILAGLAKIDWAMWTGVAVALGGFIVNIIFKIREDRRQERESAARIRKIQCRKCDDE